MSELTREEIEDIREEGDTYSDQLHWLAPRTHDAEKRAEQAEADHAEAERRLEEARQEAEKLREWMRATIRSLRACAAQHREEGPRADSKIVEAVRRGKAEELEKTSDLIERQISAALHPSDAPAREPKRQKIDRPWHEYPAGTKAHAVQGGHWIKQESGHWKWHCGSSFPRPGGDAIAVTLPAPADRPEPSEALEAFSRVRDFIADCEVGDTDPGTGKNEENREVDARLVDLDYTIRPYLSQLAPAVPGNRDD